MGSDTCNASENTDAALSMTAWERISGSFCTGTFNNGKLRITNPWTRDAESEF